MNARITVRRRIDSRAEWRLVNSDTGACLGVSQPFRTVGVARDAAEYVTTVNPNTPTVLTTFEREGWRWILMDGDTTLLRGCRTHPFESTARRLGYGAAETVNGSLTIDDKETGTGFSVDSSSSVLSRIRHAVTRGRRHRKLLGEADVVISVSGSRGKSSSTDLLATALQQRGYDVLTKKTGNQPTFLVNDEGYPIERDGPQVTLYENAAVIEEFLPRLLEADGPTAVVFENQSLTAYTMRLFNNSFAVADAVLVTNVRRDHVDTLGKSRASIGRSFARSVSGVSDVIISDQDDGIAGLFADTVGRQTTIHHVTVDNNEICRPMVCAVSRTLQVVGEDGLTDDRIESEVARRQPSWWETTSGRVFDASPVNDIDSTERVRQSLPASEQVHPLVFLRSDRRGRTAQFVSYINELADKGHVDEVTAIGGNADVFAKRVTVPCETFSADRAVLDDTVERIEEQTTPVVLMGNTVDIFMRELKWRLRERIVVTEAPRSDGIATGQRTNRPDISEETEASG